MGIVLVSLLSKKALILPAPFFATKDLKLMVQPAEHVRQITSGMEPLVNVKVSCSSEKNLRKHSYSVIFSFF